MGTGLSLPAPFVCLLGLGVTAWAGGMQTAQTALPSTATLLWPKSHPSLGWAKEEEMEANTAPTESPGTWHSRDLP